MNTGHHWSTPASAAVIAGSLAALDAQIATRRTVADRVWAWAYVAHAVAVAEITDVAGATVIGIDGMHAADRAPGTTAAVWVSPQMAWAMDDLIDAGVRTTAPEVPRIDASDRPGVITGALRRLVVTAQAADDAAPPGLQEAVRAAGRRAVLAHEAYAGPLP